MSLTSKQIANLFNGVSQQTPALRLPSQASEQLNAMSAPVEGLHKRAPTDFIKLLMAGTPSKPLVHSINRDILEKYQVVIADGDLKVFDLIGRQKTVTFPNGKDYLKTPDARGDIKTLTVEDYTFVVNRTVRAALSTTPYLVTDRVVATLNFGDGTLGNPVTQAVPAGARFVALWHARTTSTANPEGWLGVPGNPFASAQEAYAGWHAYVNSAAYGGSATPVEFKPTISAQTTILGKNPEYFNSTTSGTPAHRGFGVRIAHSEQLSVQNPSLNGGASWDPQLSIMYQRSQFASLPENSLNSLRDDVGWPAEPYRTPGATYTSNVMPVFDGFLNVLVNGSLFSIGQQNGWSATQYLNYFVGQISAAFPALTVTTNAGWQMVITGPAGERINVSAWDTNRRGYVKSVYADLPVQEAVFIVIKAGVAEQTYAVSINGTQFSYTAGASTDPATYKVDTVANSLAAAINAGSQFQAAVFGGFIKVISPSKTPMTFAFHDTWNDQAMYAMKNRVQAFEDLPGKFVPGHPIEVVGVDGKSGFYVHYTLKGVKPPQAYGLERQVTIERLFTTITPGGNTWSAQEGLETGLWEECAKPGTPDTLIPHTMPHVLVSNADGTFTFKVADWFKRSCGNSDSVPAPSFVGKAFQDIFFHRNRLGFMTHETVVLSRAGAFFNFWSSTARDVLDGDPIDLQVNHTKVSTLRHTAVFNNTLLLFSDNTQFVLSAPQLLSPKTVAITPSTEFMSSPICKPVTVGQSVNFVSTLGDYSSLWEYFVETNAVSNTAQNVSAHIPKYLPKDIYKLVASSSMDMVLALSDAEPNVVYVFKFLWGNEGKLQQSFSKWVLPEKILNADFMENTLVLTLQAADGVYLETMDLKEGKTDGALGFKVHLDRKVLLTGVSSGDALTYTLPYPVPTGLKAVRADRGTEVPLEVTGSHTVKLPLGTGASAYFGKPYALRYTFSPVYMRDKENVPVLGSTLMLKTWSVSFEKTLEFAIEVTPEKRPTRSHKFFPKVTGISALIGGIPKPVSDVFMAPVMGEGKTTRIELVSNSHYPCYFQSVLWQANYTTKGLKG